MASPCNPQDTQRRTPRLAGKGGQGTGRTAYGIRGYIRSMKRTKCRMQADRGKQGRNTRAMNYKSAEGTSRDSEPHAAIGHRRQGCNGRQSLWREPPGILIHMHTERSKSRRTEIGFGQGQHRQALHAEGAVTQRQGSRALADAEQVAEAAQPGRKWMGLMKRSRANVVGPSPGVFFHQPPTGRMGGLCHHRQHARGPSENSAPLRGEPRSAGSRRHCTVTAP